jgi:hypothetical protein
MANPWVPLESMCAVKDFRQSPLDKRFGERSRCPVCGNLSLILKEATQNCNYNNRSSSTETDSVCGHCGSEVSVKTQDYLVWPFKPGVDPNFLNQINQVAMEIMAEAAGSFKDEKDMVAVRLRALAKKLKKELEKYGA